jgi:hypothetical protein
METTVRLIAFLCLLRRVKVLSRKIVQEILFPGDKDGAVTREFLRKALHAGYIARFGHRSDLYVQVAPVYLPTEKGCCLVATVRGDMKFLFDCSPRLSAQDVPHALAVSRTILDLDKAVAAQQYVQVPQLFTEHCILNPDEPESAKRRRLFQIVGKAPTGGNIVCIPDLAALIQVGSFTRCLCFEYETGSEGSPSRAAARKAPGYFGLNKGQFYKQYFGQPVNDFRCVAICPNAAWRECFRRALKERPGHELWLTVASQDLRPETFLHSPIYYSCNEETPRCLVKPRMASVATPLITPLQEAGAR